MSQSYIHDVVRDKLDAGFVNLEGTDLRMFVCNVARSIQPTFRMMASTRRFKDDLEEGSKQYWKRWVDNNNVSLETDPTGWVGAIGSRWGGRMLKQGWDVNGDVYNGPHYLK